MNLRLHRHIGIYAYRVAILRKFSLSPQSEDEKKEKLEQLRAYSLNMSIKVEEAESIPGPDVDTPDDLIKGSINPRMTEQKHRILFVCMGNICRSPTAEGLLIEKVNAEKPRKNLRSIPAEHMTII